MSEPGRDSVPTSADPRSQRPTKRRAVTPPLRTRQPNQHSLQRPVKRNCFARDRKQAKRFLLAPPPEIVANVQGSSAGAGSGEFHVYKASRRREYERLRMMQSEVDKEKGDEEWEKERAETKRKDDEKTEKNRRRREKKKAARGKKGVDEPKAPGTAVAVDKNVGIKGPRAPGLPNEQDGAADEQQQYEEVPGVIIHEDD
ncbi:hypothetical protein N7450_004673 [Penicillium hetheringtonii]|uniref:DUF1168 domain protein n=1 Tax=Penicillium hetheringtonii TaxID=911720 RepID=A0AAD6GTL2_9EURO|nr:hypothetical protein N7450_004673 [Penicillium hetheringtonii]